MAVVMRAFFQEFVKSKEALRLQSPGFAGAVFGVLSDFDRANDSFLLVGFIESIPRFLQFHK